jgi:transducin (beta)-like 1
MVPQSPESRLLASVSDDGYVLVWKLPSYPAERGRLGSRSASPVKSGTPNVGNVILPKEENEDYFEGQGKKGKEGIEFCVARLCVVDAENKRLNALEWSPACREGMMLLAA